MILMKSGYSVDDINDPARVVFVANDELVAARLAVFML